jgi:uncharacterized protein YjbJ (UPF0337 family)
MLLLIERQIHMDKDRVNGSAKQTEGAVKETIGRVTGNTKLEAEGKSDKIARKGSKRGRRPQGRAPLQIDIKLKPPSVRKVYHSRQFGVHPGNAGQEGQKS